MRISDWSSDVCSSDLLATDTGESIALGIVVGLAQPCLDELVDGRVDTADEEAGDAGDPAGIAAPRNEVLETTEIRRDDLLVNLLREKERDIDVDPLADEFQARSEESSVGERVGRYV